MLFQMDRESMEYCQLHCSLCRNLRYSQMAPVTMFAEKNTKSGPQNQHPMWNSAQRSHDRGATCQHRWTFWQLQTQSTSQDPQQHVSVFSRLNHIQLANLFDFAYWCNLMCVAQPCGVWCQDLQRFLFMAKGGGSANKTYLYQQTKAQLCAAGSRQGHN